MKNLECKGDDGTVVAIVYTKEWFKELFAAKKMPYIIPEDYFVVCQWHDFHDGEKSNIEGKQTIAICREFTDAETIYNTNCNILIKRDSKKAECPNCKQISIITNSLGSYCERNCGFELIM